MYISISNTKILLGFSMLRQESGMQKINSAETAQQ